MCIEVASDDGTRVLLDLGMPLYDDAGNDFPFGTGQRPTRELIAARVLPDVPGLYADDPESPVYSAIILTHAHLDHYGLAHHAHPSIPVYGSSGTLALIDVGRVFFPGAQQPSDLRELPTDWPLTIGGLTVTAIPVDHSAPDSRAILAEADGQRLLYSGDLRSHGRTGYRFESLLNDERVRGVDALLLEGTTLGAPSGSHGFPRESDVESELVHLTAERPDALVAVFASGQNLDRLVSCYRAAKRSGRLLVVSAYQAYVLRRLAPLSANIPQFEWPLVRVKFHRAHYKTMEAAGLLGLVEEMRPHRVSTDQLAENPGRYIWSAGSNRAVTGVIDRVSAQRVIPVWSMWRGYWEREGNPTRQWCERRGVEPRFVHSGGHAGPEELARLADAVGAGTRVWVHTECGGRSG